METRYGIQRDSSTMLRSARNDISAEFLARNWRVRERNSAPIHIPVAVPLLAAGAQDYLAVPDFSARDTILIGILNHVTS